jgi:hypothetical protein
VAGEVDRVVRAAGLEQQRIEHAVEVGGVLGQPVGVARRRVGQAEAAPVEREHVAVGRERVDDELERGRDVHPAVLHHERRAIGRGHRGVAPFEHVGAQTAHGDELAAAAALDEIGFGAHWEPLYAVRARVRKSRA